MMIHQYAFSNFQSFRERVEVDFRISHKVAMTDWMAEALPGERVSNLMAVLGPNGGGKTALIKAAAFLEWFITDSFKAPPDSGIPFEPHFSASNEPSEFEILCDFDGRLWRYVLRCTKDRVLHEALYTRRERFGYVFVRDWNEASNRYDVKQKDFGFASREALKVRPNASLISTAAQYGVPLAARMMNTGFASNVNLFGRLPMGNDAIISAAKHFSATTVQHAEMERLLIAWDLGLAGVDLQELQINQPGEPETKVWFPFGRHRLRNGERALPFSIESSGTQGAFVLLSRLLPALAVGGLAVIDEFENNLHPYMLEPILELFANPATNPHNAQLLFSCHAPEVLNLIHKSQVILVEKDEFCESSASRMDAIEGIRNDDNFYAKYMGGAYGAVPVL